MGTFTNCTMSLSAGQPPYKHPISRHNFISHSKNRILTDSVSVTESRNRSQMAGSSPSRPQIKVVGSSRNPEYNLAACRPHFKRDQSGKRLAPVAQLNSHAGRVLARQQSAKCPSYTEGRSPLSPGNGKSGQPRDPSTGAEPEQHHRMGRVPFIPPHNNDKCATIEKAAVRKPIQRAPPVDNSVRSDRDHLSSQRPLVELSQEVETSRGNSCKSTSRRSSVAESDITLSLICPECKQSDSHTTKGRSTSVCKTCKRFVQTANITALDSPINVVTEEPEKPLQHSKYSTVPACRTCVIVPGDLHHEYLQFFPACSVCGHLTDVILKDLVDNEGTVSALTGDNGKPILGVSKKLRDWCAFVAHEAHPVVRNNSKKSIASSISSTASASLRRKGAVRRTPTNSTTSSVLSDGKPKLIAVSEAQQNRPNLTRRFSFDAIGNPDTGAARMAATTPRTTSAKNPLPGQAREMDDEKALPPLPNDDKTYDEADLRSDFVSVPLETPVPQVLQRPVFEARDSVSKFHTARPEVKRTFSEILGPNVQVEEEYDEEEEPETTLRRQPSAQFLLPRFLQGSLFSTGNEGKYEDV
ncbi:hypothetical protein K491DRAFT_727215 [Lophiostoma macrostomum CBS 122681]|uniref:Uncharacterized protein n=1 Tax=Lophiostoma macrostomum CBS 122681 TaxID=1314788 RepID=A0A6A6TL32_9PLEO|nr:hypothetical protein K491DRAFT_727215 [Lophiostoma macrostomum CBS 122681]